MTAIFSEEDSQIMLEKRQNIIIFYAIELKKNEMQFWGSHKQVNYAKKTINIRHTILIE